MELKHKYINRVDLISNDFNRIVLYGAGKRGIQLYRIYRECGINVTCFADQEKRGMKVDDIYIIGRDELRSSDCIIVTIEDENVRNDVVKNMINDGLSPFFPHCGWEWIENIMGTFNVDLNKDFLDAYCDVDVPYLSKVKVYMMWASRLGEFVYRFQVMNEEIDKKSDYIIVPNTGDTKKHVLANNLLFDICLEHLNIVNKDNAKYWLYMFLFNSDVFDISDSKYFESYKSKIKWRSGDGFTTLVLQDEKKNKCNEVLREHGIQGKYVCVFGRDNGYMSTEYKTDDKSLKAYEHRNNDIKVFDKLVDYLIDNGYGVVRVGKWTNQKYDREGVFDLPGDKYNEELDLYINANCHMWIGTDSGAGGIARAFGRRICILNLVGVLTSSFTYGFYDNEMFTCTLYYLKNENRYLNIWEMMKIDLFDGNRSAYEKKYGIKIVDNNEDDILEAYKESNLRYEGKWVDDNNGKKLQEKYKKIIDHFIQKYGELQYMDYEWKVRDLVITNPISTSFLTRHPFLVDDVKTEFI